MYLTLQIWWLLVLAFLLGALFGYLIWRACASPRLKSQSGLARAEFEDRIRNLETQNVRLAALAATAEAAVRRADGERDAAFSTRAAAAPVEARRPSQSNGSFPAIGDSDARADGSDGDAVAPHNSDMGSNGFLAAPRDGKADNLRLLRGIGPRLEKILHSMGVFHFDQIAGWTETDLAAIDRRLGDFAGRAVRDKWIEQSRKLVDGARDGDGSGNATS